LYFVEEIPADLYAEMPRDAPGTSGFEFHHSPAHQWWYFPGMTRDEVLFFKFNDSDHTRAWRVPHSAFLDPTVRDARPRHSIEFRTVAYFE
ncbi:MAG: CmcJ/NvfI family oxidoreductase, partial [Trebonia sp.]